MFIATSHPKRNRTLSTRRSTGILLTGALVGGSALSLALLNGTPASAANDVQTIKVKATEGAKGTYAFEGLPATLKGGNMAFELTNTGKEPHDLQIVRVDGKHSTAEVMKVIESKDAPTPAWLHADGGVGSVAPGGVGRATVNLGAGAYVVVCTMSNDTTHKSHAAGGMGKSVTVTGSKAAALPTGATATITAKEYGFETKGLKAGKNIVEFVAAGKELHHFLMFPMMPGKTIQDAQKALTSDKPPAGPPPLDFAKSQGSSVIEKSEGSLLTEINLTAGRYAMACFMSDRAGGPPHVMKGMLLEVVVK